MGNEATSQKDPKYATAFKVANKYTRTCGFWSLVLKGRNLFRFFKKTKNKKHVKKIRELI